MTTTLVNGEVRGLRWFELPRDIYGDVKGLRGDRDAPVVTVLAAPDDYPKEKRIAEYFNPAYGKTFLPSIGFRPVDEAKDLPGRLVGYAHPYGKSVRSWLAQTFQVPEGIEIEYDYPDYSWDRKLVVVATTVKDGRIVKVRKKVDPNVLLEDALAKIFKGLVRSAPKPPAEAHGRSCGAHLAKILRHATTGAVDMIRAWEKDEDRREPRSIAGALLPGTGIEVLTLKSTKTSNAVLAEIKLKGGHVVSDDTSGIKVQIAGSLPHTLLNGLAGEKLGRVLDLEWAELITIRSAAAIASDAAEMRAHAPGVPFVVPKAEEMTDERARRIIRGVAAGSAIKNIDEALFEKLAAMTPQAAATMLLAINHHEYYDLKAHGLPGWWASNQNGYVTLNRSPMREAGDLATLF